MFVATLNRPLATTITGSLPRPEWFTLNLAGPLDVLSPIGRLSVSRAVY